MNKSSKSRLTDKQLSHFQGDTLFDKIARAVCRAGTLPAKELFEAWEVARRVRRKYRGGRIVDMACGHGLLGHIMLLLDDSSEQAICVDAVIPTNAAKLSGEILARWPRLNDRVHPIVAKVGGLQSLGAKDAAVVNLLQVLGNAGSGVLRLSRRGKKMAYNRPDPQVHHWFIPHMVS